MHANMDIINLINDIIIDATHNNASDIHFETQPNDLRVRFRIDGLLHIYSSYSLEICSNIITRLKLLAQCDIAEKRLPQDGRFTFNENKMLRDCRLSTCPTTTGEKIVIRLLDPNQHLLDINQLGMEQEQLKLFKKNLKKTQGLILVTGPTGSGKSITLYSALNTLNQTNVNIITIENPVEIELPGINQINTRHNIGLDFARILKAILRQDPDIIMIGEIRDNETAEMAIHAAQTGHLVFASLHANNSLETITRLHHLGISIYESLSSINLIIAQRLLRKISNGDYSGRTGIFELLVFSDPLKDLILSKSSLSDIKSLLQNTQFLSLKEAAEIKLKKGITDECEINRVLGSQ